MDAMASIALYDNRPQRALGAARNGILKAPTRHPLAVRLRAQAARTHARLGQREECEELFNEARELYERLPSIAPTRFTVETGTLASYAITAYPASAYIWLKNFGKAKAAAEEAVAVHESAPAESRSPSREAIAHIDLAVALAELGSADEAVGQGRLALASSRVVDSVLSRAGDLSSVLTARYPDLPHALDFSEQYRQMVSAAR
jgi:tetratricopeptide (TPR) repeat protein